MDTFKMGHHMTSNIQLDKINSIYVTEDGKTFHKLGKMTRITTHRVAGNGPSDLELVVQQPGRGCPTDSFPDTVVTQEPETDERPTIITVKATYHDSEETYKGVGYALKYSSDRGLHIRTADGREIGYHPPGSYWSVKVKEGPTEAEEKALWANLFKDSHDATTQPPTGDRYNFWRFK